MHGALEMSRPMTQQTVAVIGASRGFGRATAEAFARSGNTVLAMSRTESELLDLQTSLAGQGTLIPIVGDATDPDSARTIIAEHRPDVLVLVAGATPTMAPLHEQTWDEFKVNWDTDVKLTHAWLTEALKAPLRPGSRVIVISSGAARAGSPLSGGYAGAKATQHFLTSYAHEESRRRGLEITFSAVLPQITPLAHVGDVGSQAYADWEGITQEAYMARIGEPLTPAAFGSAIRTLTHLDPEDAAGSFLLTASGLKPLPS